MLECDRFFVLIRLRHAHTTYIHLPGHIPNVPLPRHTYLTYPCHTNLYMCTCRTSLPHQPSIPIIPLPQHTHTPNIPLYHTNNSFPALPCHTIDTYLCHINHPNIPMPQHTHPTTQHSSSLTVQHSLPPSLCYSLALLLFHPG